MSTYLDQTVAEIRQLKTHGEKRVRVVLEVFHAVHEMLAGAQPGSHLSLNLVPAFVPPVEDYLTRLNQENPVLASRDELARNLVQPLLNQVLTDSGEAVYALSRDRLGIGVPQKSVREQSREMGVTRARVYQLLEDCGKIMAVRWPRGGQMLKRLDHFADPQAKALATMTRQLFFPENGETQIESNNSSTTSDPE